MKQFNTKEIAVETPVGEIKALPCGSPGEYPGIRIVVNGVSVACVEYDEVKAQIRVRTYDHTSDEPRDIYSVITENDL